MDPFETKTGGMCPDLQLQGRTIHACIRKGAIGEGQY